MTRPARPELEITQPVLLCRPDGSLDANAVGWTRRPLHECNLSGSWGRNKRWDYWCVTSDDVVISVTVADVDYLGLASVWLRDRHSQRFSTIDCAFPLGAGVSLPATVGEAVVVAQRGNRIELIPEPGGTRVRVEGKMRRTPVEIDLFAALPEGHETMGVVIPWSDRRFQYTSKHNTRPVAGSVRLGGDVVELGPENDAWAFVDYGRGRWPYRVVWNWGSGSGSSAGHVVGIQVGGKWTEGTGMTENALCIDGRLTKIGHELIWSYDLAAPLATWRVRSPASDQIDLHFVPEWHRPTALSLGVASHRGELVFGRWYGSVRPAPDGPSIDIEGIYGSVEEVRWRW